MDEFRRQMTQITEWRLRKDDWRKPVPGWGYNIYSTTAQDGDEPVPGPDDFFTESVLGSEWKNYLRVTLGWIWRAGDLSIIGHAEMKALVWTVASNWNPPWANAGIHDAGAPPSEANNFRSPDHLANDPFFAPPNGPQRRPYGRPWVSYLSAERSAGLVIPSALVSERTPDGGMLISATTDQFDPENAEQLERSLLLSEIMLERGGDPGI